MSCHFSLQVRRFHRHSLPSQGFTFVELLVLMTIFAITVSLLMPALAENTAMARNAQCANNQDQIHNAWVAANAKLPKPVAPTDWPKQIRPYLENAKEVFACPENAAAATTVSYGMNTRSSRMAAGDAGRVLLLDFADVDVKVVGQTIAQLNESWPKLAAARHNKQEIVTFMDGHIELKAPSDIDPRYCHYFAQYWRPVQDAKILLPDCEQLGVKLPGVSEEDGEKQAEKPAVAPQNSQGGKNQL